MRSFAGLLVALGLAASSPAHATQLAALSVEQMTDAADYVVRGTVREVWAEEDARGIVWTKASIDVAEAWKGAPPSTLVVESPGGALPDGTFTEVHLAARYSPGEDVVLFVARKGGGERLGTVAMYGGKYTVRQNPADGSDMVVHFTVPYSKPYDARFIPHPPVSERVSLVSLESRVEARVALGWDGQPIPGVAPDHLRSINKLQPGVK